MTKNMQSTALSLHCHEGRVWYANPSPEFELGSMSIAEFMSRHRFPSNKQIRLLGSPCNAEIILFLSRLQHKNRPASLVVGSPRIAKGSAIDEPSAILTTLSDNVYSMLPSSLGGFHEVNAFDVAAYGLIDTLTKCPGDEAAIFNALTAHPAWRPLSFIRSLNRVPTAHLLASIVDPRWHIDLDEPDSGKPLRDHLGLNELGRLTAIIRSPGPFQSVINCWKDTSIIESVLANLHAEGLRPVSQSQASGTAPYDFVWRAWVNELESENSTCGAINADLRASQMFVRFLCLTWLGELYRKTNMPDLEAPLFRPSDFFKHPIEVGSYEVHQIATGMM